MHISVVLEDRLLHRKQEQNLQCEAHQEYPPPDLEHCRLYWRTDPQTDGQTHGQTERPTDRRTHPRTDGQTERPTDRRTDLCVAPRNSSRPSVVTRRARSKGFTIKSRDIHNNPALVGTVALVCGPEWAVVPISVNLIVLLLKLSTLIDINVKNCSLYTS